MSRNSIRMSVSERTLKSGLTLLAVHNPGVQTYACVVSLDTRVADDPAGMPGVANMVGETLDEGTSRYDALELASAAESLGAALEGNYRGGMIMCPAPSQKKATELLREMVLEPSFPGREVRRVQSEVLTEMQAELDDPRTVAAQRFRRRIYGDHVLGRSMQGTLESVAAVKPKHLRDYHRQGSVRAAATSQSRARSSPSRCWTSWSGRSAASAVLRRSTLRIPRSSSARPARSTSRCRASRSTCSSATSACDGAIRTSTSCP